jgi:hypothetical protein
MGDGRTSVRGGYGLYFNTNNQQNLIVTVTNPPFTPRPVFVNPTFPNPPFERPFSNSIRPIQYDLELPRLHMWNVNVQREVGWQTVMSVGYAGSRGTHLLRSNDVNVATPQTRADGTPFIPAGTPRMNPAFTTIELKSSDGESWYKALMVEARKRLSGGVALQSSYTLSRAEDTTQASTFFSDSTTGTTTAFPEFIPGYNKGLSDFHATHNWILNFTWEAPFGRDLTGAAGVLLRGWQMSGSQPGAAEPLTASCRRTGRDRSGFRLWRRVSARIDRAMPQATARRTPCSADQISGSIRRPSRCRRPVHSATPGAATSSARACGRSIWPSSNSTRACSATPADWRFASRCSTFSIVPTLVRRLSSRSPGMPMGNSHSHRSAASGRR